MTIGPCRALDHHFSITAPSAEVADHVATLFGSLAVADGASPLGRYQISEDPGEKPAYSLTFDGAPIVRSPVPGTVISHLVWHMNGTAVSASSHRLFLLHAASAANGTDAVLLPGRSGAGKSTLVAGLVVHGLSYLTDEISAVDPVNGVLIPYPKPINLERGSWDVLPELAPRRTPVAAKYDFGEWLVDPRRIRPDAVAGPARPAVVVFPTFEAGRLAELEAMSRAECAVALIANSFNGHLLGPTAFDAAVALARRCRCYRLTFGDLEEACRLVISLVD